MLQKIQKALGEYLETERSGFPRFYFVGDEDLLEIIGNSKSIPRLQKHFKKMFAGVNTLVLEDADKIIKGLCSREGEQVKFEDTEIISTEKHAQIKEWLGRVESSMKTALAKRFHVSFLKFEVLNFQNYEELAEWLDFSEAQLINLCARLKWTRLVENVFSTGGDLSEILKNMENKLDVLATSVLGEQPPLRRRKLEELIKCFVHLRDMTAALCKDPKILDCITAGGKNLPFSWLVNMRMKYDDSVVDPIDRLTVNIADTSFIYGYEYLGVQESLVQSALTDRCYTVVFLKCRF